MIKLKTIVVEDEPLAREGLLMYIRETDTLELVAVCEDALQANTTLAAEKVDLMFLDIQMPKLTGIDFLKSLSNPPLVIMTTAYPNFALQGFELDVIDYLVKPYPFDRYLRAVNKAVEFQTLRQKSAGAGTNTEDYFFVKVDYRYEKIHYNDILYIEGMENYVTIYTGSQKYVTLLRMKTLEESLPAGKFIRLHKSYIASVGAIQAIDGNEVVIGTKRLPMSREKKQEIMDRVLKGK